MPKYCLSDSSPSLESISTSTESLVKAEDQNSLDTSLTTITLNIQQLLSQYKCSHCGQYIGPPIRQCRYGHLFCQICGQKFRNPFRCPTCRVDIDGDGIRNITMEVMATTLRLAFPCKYSSVGCLVSSTLTERVTHEQSCDYRPFECPIVGYNHWCLWSGIKEQVVQHLLRDHGMDDCLRHLIPRGWRLCKRYHFKSEDFLFVLTNRDNTFNALILFIGDQQMADKFRYRLELVNESEGFRLLFEGRPKSIRQTIDSQVFRAEGLHFNRDVILQYFNGSRFAINIEISY